MTVHSELGAAMLAAEFDYGYGAPAVVLIYAVLALLIGAAIGARAPVAPNHRYALIMVSVLLAAWLVQVVVGVDAFAAALVLILAVFALPAGYVIARRARTRRGDR